MTMTGLPQWVTDRLIGGRFRCKHCLVTETSEHGPTCPKRQSTDADRLAAIRQELTQGFHDDNCPAITDDESDMVLSDFQECHCGAKVRSDDAVCVLLEQLDAALAGRQQAEQERDTERQERLIWSNTARIEQRRAEAAEQQVTALTQQVEQHEVAWSNLGTLLKTGGMHDPSFLYGQVEAELSQSRALRIALDEARYLAKVLVSAWDKDARPPADVVARARNLPIVNDAALAGSRAPKTTEESHG